MFIKIILIVIFVITVVVVGWKTRKRSTDVTGFVLGGRKVGPWLTAFAYGTSYFSAVIFVGYAGQFGWHFGVAATWAGIGNALIGSLMAWAILGRRTRIMTQHLDARTMPEYLGKRYESDRLKVLASLITFVFLIPYTASLFNGLSRLFEMAFSVDYAYCVIVMSVLTGIYVILGGYMATAVNDFIQGIIMLVGIAAIILAVLQKNGGLMGSLTEMSKIESAVDPSYQGVYTSFFGPMPLFLLVVVLLTSLGTWGLPQMVAKYYAISNEGAVKKGTIISTLFAFVVAGGCYFLGGFGRLFVTQEQVDAEGFDSIVPTMLSGLPDILIAIVLVLVLSASMSTLSSLVLTSSSTLTLDFIAPLRKKAMGEYQKLHMLHFFVAFFIIISAIIAIVQAKSRITFIAQLMGVSWGALAGAFLAPFMYGLYWKKVTRTACGFTYVWGPGLMIIQLCISLGLFQFQGGVLGFIFQNSLYSGVFAMLSSLILVPVISLLTPGSRPAKVNDMFSCYDTTVLVHSKTALADENE